MWAHLPSGGFLAVWQITMAVLFPSWLAKVIDERSVLEAYKPIAMLTNDIDSA
jgi:hypothetical protein